MFKSVIVLFACIAFAAAKPGLLGAPLAYTAAAAVVAAPAPFVTATSSQVIARNYNGIATAPVVAPVAAPLIAKTIAAPVAAAYTVPIAAAYSTPIVTKYAAATPLAYNTPLTYSAPLTYAAAHALF